MISFQNLKVQASEFFKKNGPSIAIGVGITGMFGAGVWAVSQTPKALILLEEAEKEKQEELTTLEKVKTTWKIYIGPLLLDITSAASIIYGTRSVIRGSAALATLYQMSEAAFADYKEAVKEEVGKTKEEKIRVAAENKAIERDFNNSPTLPIYNVGSNGHFIYKEPWSGRYFYADRAYVERCWGKFVDQVNSKLYDPYSYSDNELHPKRTTEGKTLNEFYEILGLEDTLLGEEFMFWPREDLIDSMHFLVCQSPFDESCTVLDYDDFAYKSFRE